jgi:hypothetical protein
MPNQSGIVFDFQMDVFVSAHLLAYRPAARYTAGTYYTSRRSSTLDA